MKFVISTQEINYILNKCQNAIAQKSTIPVLSNFMIQAKKSGQSGQLIITATDLGVGIRCITEAKVLEEGATTLPGKKLASLLRELTAINVEFFTNEHHLTEILADSSRFKLHGMGCEDFPALPSFEDAIKVVLPQQVLKDMFFRTAFAVSKEDNRYALTGVLLRVANGKAYFIGTDGKRLASSHMDVALEPTFTGSYIIPIRGVEEVFKCLKEEGPVSLFLKSDKIAIETEDTFLVTKLLVGEYPDVTRVIPEKAEFSVLLHREELITLLRQVALFAPDAHHSVRFTFAEGELKLSANTMEIGEGKVSMPVNYQGPELSIAFNPTYFLDVLRHTRGETVAMGLTDSFNPGVVTDQEGITAPTKESSPLYVIMPMRLNGEV